MPEGHVTHGLARDLRRTLLGAAVRASSPQGRFADGAALLDGQLLTRTDAWGKYLFLHFGAGRILHIHLGLIGKLRPIDASALPGAAVRLRLENDAIAWQLTGPTRCALITPEEKKAILAPLGADPLRRHPDVPRMRDRMGRKNSPLGAVLLDQTVIAGIGNVYRAELLFLQGIHPLRAASSLADAEVGSLWEETVHQLKRGLRLGRIVTTDPVEIGRSVSRMRPEDRLYVYHRTHCRWCGSELQTLVLGGRPMQLCPVHQPLLTPVATR
jgi:endonuclease VIII